MFFFYLITVFVGWIAEYTLLVVFVIDSPWYTKFIVGFYATILYSIKWNKEN